MNQRNLSIISVVCVLFLSTLACDLPFQLPFLSGLGLPEGISMGETYHSERGGFSISRVNEYTFQIMNTGVRMVAPNASTVIGPVIDAKGELFSTAMTVQQVFAKLKSTSLDAKFSDEKDISVNGFMGLQATISGISSATAVKGQVVIVMVSSTQSFILLGNAPEKQWDNGVSVIFDRLLESVTLFKASLASTQTLTAAIKTATKPISTSLPQPSLTLVKTTTTQTPIAKPQVIRQWAKSAVASSEYDNLNWSANQATGAPNTLECGDNETAWASDGSDSVEWLELTYATPVYPTEVTIYQSYNPSAVVEVKLISTTGENYTILKAQPEVVNTCPFDYTLNLLLNKTLLVNKVRITIDQSLMNDWTEIDAVELVGSTTFTAQTGVAPTVQLSTPLPTLAGQNTATKNNTPNVGFYCTMNKDGKDTWYSSIEVDYYSTAGEYVLGFNTPDMTQKVTLYLPKPLNAKMFPLVDFNPAAVNKAPSAAIFYTPSNYYAKAGSFLIITELANNAITGAVTLITEKAGEPGKMVNAVCSFSKVVLK